MKNIHSFQYILIGSFIAFTSTTLHAGRSSSGSSRSGSSGGSSRSSSSSYSRGSSGSSTRSSGSSYSSRPSSSPSGGSSYSSSRSSSPPSSTPRAPSPSRTPTPTPPSNPSSVSQSARKTPSTPPADQRSGINNKPFIPALPSDANRNARQSPPVGSGNGSGANNNSSRNNSSSSRPQRNTHAAPQVASAPPDGVRKVGDQTHETTGNRTVIRDANNKQVQTINHRTGNVTHFDENGKVSRITSKTGNVEKTQHFEPTASGGVRLAREVRTTPTGRTIETQYGKDGSVKSSVDGQVVYHKQEKIVSVPGSDGQIRRYKDVTVTRQRGFVANGKTSYQDVSYGRRYGSYRYQDSWGRPVIVTRYVPVHSYSSGFWDWYYPGPAYWGYRRSWHYGYSWGWGWGYSPWCPPPALVYNDPILLMVDWLFYGSYWVDYHTRLSYEQQQIANQQAQINSLQQQVQQQAQISADLKEQLRAQTQQAVNDLKQGPQVAQQNASIDHVIQDKQHVFMIHEPISVASVDAADEDPIALSEGDIIQVISEPNEQGLVTAEIGFTKTPNVRAKTHIEVSLKYLQELENEYRSRLEDGLKEMEDKKNLTPAP